MSISQCKSPGPKTLLASFAIGAFASSVLHATNDWPGYRGADRTGTWNQENVLEQFPQPELPAKWRAPIGAGYSGPTVAGDRVFVMDRPEEKEEERILCFDRKTGEQRWVHTYPCSYEEVGYSHGPRASVTIDNDRAYAIGTMGHLHCLDTTTGEVLWDVDCEEVYSIDLPLWGIAGSPLVEGDLVIVQIGGADGACIVAFDKNTGDEAWRALDDKASYVSPMMIEQAGKRILIAWTGARIAAMDAASGEIHWEMETPPKRWPINISAPVLDESGERMFLTTIQEGSRLLKLDTDELAMEQLWARSGVSEQNTDALQCMISPPLFLGDYVYGFDSKGELRCLDAATGDRIWESIGEAVRDGIWSTVFMVQNGDRTWMFTEEGNLVIAELSPEGYTEISRTKIIEPSTFLRRRSVDVAWSHPAFAGTEVFARNDRELVCVDVGP
ncbi:MAG: PQQ-binding-like beta-propeller repeat protein [Verrucomicrobiota bacterium]